MKKTNKNFFISFGIGAIVIILGIWMLKNYQFDINLIGKLFVKSIDELFSLNKKENSVNLLACELIKPVLLWGAFMIGGK